MTDEEENNLRKEWDDMTPAKYGSDGKFNSEYAFHYANMSSGDPVEVFNPEYVKWLEGKVLAK